jgi:UDP-N-acetylmuramate--alanine ligase
LEVRIFDDAGGASAPEYALAEYLPGEKSKAVFGDGKSVDLPVPGKHAALNALAIRALTGMLGFEDAAVLNALKYFDGVWRRNDFAGTTPQGAMVFDDYAHNPEKIASCLETMQSLASGKVIAIFQPHGYGPFGFMRDELLNTLDKQLRDGDVFCLLEPYYAGGTSSRKPSAPEVWSDWQKKGSHPERYKVFPDRVTLAEFVGKCAGRGDIVVVMGARDNSLGNYAKELAGS